MAAAAATQPRDPSRDVVSAPRAAGASSGWALFDPRAVTGGFGSSSAAPSPTAAASVTSSGASVRISLRIEPPPGVSYVEVVSGDRFHENPTVVAAAADLLLIRMVFNAGDEPRADLFVYRADPERPSLRRLPDPPCRWADLGLPHAGIVRGGDGEFLVADLQTREMNLGRYSWTYVTELLRYSSAADRWEVTRVEMPEEEDSGYALRPSAWETDAAFSSGGLVYWADYHRGVLYCDAAADDPKLRFVDFPGVETPAEDFRYGDEVSPERYRTACIDGGGALRFVDVDDGEWGCVVMRTWALRTPALGSEGWELQQTVELDGVLSPFWEYRVTPAFPVVSMEEGHVVHMVVRDPDDDERWMVTVDTGSGSLRSCDMLQRGQEAEGPEEETCGDATNILGDTPLIWCEVCKYVSP